MPKLISNQKVTDASKIYLEEHPYTQIFNDVIVNIKDNDAFRIYCYLISKSRDWKVIKEWTTKQCGIGERKAKQCWSYLERCGLLEYIKVRDESGKFTHHDVRILNGTKFNPNEPFLKPTANAQFPNDTTTGAETAPVEKLSTETHHHRCNNPPSGESTRVDFAPLLNKDLLPNKDFATKERKSFCADAPKKPKSEKTKAEWAKENQKRHEWADKVDMTAQSKQQMESEAKYIKQNEDFKRAPMPEELREKIRKMWKGGPIHGKATQRGTMQTNTF